MNKPMKKALAAVLAVLAIVSLASSAFAAEDSAQILSIQLGGKEVEVQAMYNSSIQNVWNGEILDAVLFSADGCAAYSLEPVLQNSGGAPSPGKTNYTELATKQRQQIAAVVALNPEGTRDNLRYMAAQTIIWQIVRGERFGGGTIYNSVIFPNRKLLYDTYMEMVEGLERGSSLPSFLSANADKPQKHTMEQRGRSWRVKLTNDNPDIELDELDFDVPEPFTLTVSGDTVTVECEEKPDKEDIIQWRSPAGRGSGIVFCAGKSGSYVDAAQDGYMRFLLGNEEQPELAAADSSESGVKAAVTGNREVAAGDTMRYDVQAVNRSFTTLTGFTMDVTIPAGTRLEQVCTGDWPQQAVYHVLYRTNQTDEYRPLLSDASQETEMDCLTDGLLAGGEEITGVRFVYGNVLPGFQAKLTPSLTVRVPAEHQAGEKLSCSLSVYADGGIRSDALWDTSVIRVGHEI